MAPARVFWEVLYKIPIRHSEKISEQFGFRVVVMEV